MDTGPILAQAPLTLADGLTGPEADRLAAALGGELLVRALDGLADGTITPRPQPEGGWANPHAPAHRLPPGPNLVRPPGLQLHARGRGVGQTLCPGSAHAPTCLLPVPCPTMNQPSSATPHRSTAITP